MSVSLSRARAIRIDVLEDSLRGSRVGLHYLLSGFAGTEGPLLTLQRFLTLWRTGRFSGEAEESQWRVKSPTVRSQAQRLVRNARAMAARGYLKLLGV